MPLITNNDESLDLSSNAMHRRLGHSNYDGKIAGLYDLEETLGRGHFAVVKLARHVFTGEKVAVKVIDKSKLDEVSRAHLFQEVRCMKLVQHPNVVRLYEVIDTQTKLYLILELGDGGDLYDYIMRHDSGLSEEVARTYFRQIVKAISYCHRLHVVHRDLKPENVVFFEKLGTVKLTDFGFSNRFCPGQKLETSCGSLAYSAPEILLGDSYDAPAVDVWSLGVILYMLVCGQAPFQEANDSETLTMIMDCKYSIPSHVSDDCKKLIARMLVREPEGRATLEEIATDPWLGIETDIDTVEALPLVSRQQVSDDNHNLIITKMVNGNIATKEEILDALDKNEYNHITATYFLLAERKLRAHRQEQVQKTRPELLNVATRRQNDLSVNDLHVDANSPSSVNQSLLTVPRTPGDVPQNVRTRKCSIVQEEEDEDDVSSCSGRDDHGSNSALSSFNRRGSRSEGKLSHVLQERLAQLPEKPVVPIPPIRHIPKLEPKTKFAVSPSHTFTVVRVHQDTPSSDILFAKSDGNMKNGSATMESTTAVTGWSSGPIHNSSEERSSFVTQCLETVGPVPNNKWRMGSQHRISLNDSTVVPPATLLINYITGNNETATTILTESSTAPSPLRSLRDINDTPLPMKYKTMPPPSSTTCESHSPDKLTLNEILEDGNVTDESTPDRDNLLKSRVVRRTGYEQKRSKFHKARTTSCSSSDASDDDSEGRKKRAHKLGTTTGKPLPSRRDSHDDSSDSQDPGGSSGLGRGLGNGERNEKSESTSKRNDNNQSGTKSTTSTNTNTGGKVQRCTENQAMTFGRRHRAGRRRAGETRLRESQSLNRITEVQEAEVPNVCHVSSRTHMIIQNVASPTVTTTVPSQEVSSQISTTVQRAKGFGARLLQSWNLGRTAISMDIKKNSREEEKYGGTVKDDKRGEQNSGAINPFDKENNRASVNRNDCKSRKTRLLTRYFAVHKRLCVPLPGFFGKGKLYKARSCGNIARERVTPSSPKSMFLCPNTDEKWRERRHWSENLKGPHHRGSDGDINQNLDLTQFVQDSVVGNGCAGLPAICHIHLGDPSKCCSLC